MSKPSNQTPYEKHKVLMDDGSIKECYCSVEMSHTEWVTDKESNQTPDNSTAYKPCKQHNIYNPNCASCVYGTGTQSTQQVGDLAAGLLRLLTDYSQWEWERVTANHGPSPVSVPVSIGGLMKYLKELQNGQ